MQTPLASLDRRALLIGALAVAACSKSAPPAPGTTGPAPSPPPPGGAWRQASFDAGPDLPEGQRALLLSPWADKDAPPPGERPLLIALHGRGESARGLDVGANAWPNDYLLDVMHRRMLAPPLTARDLRDMTSPERLAKLNASLAAHPYRGVALACPYTPNLDDKSVQGSEPYARFLIEKLLPQLRSQVGSTVDRAATGIDGVSMGGRLALQIGLSHPEVFGVVGVLQPAIKAEEAEQISALAQKAMAKQKVLLRLVTSEEDYFLPAVRAASERLRADGVPHELLVIPGTHGYEFNRGPGAAELLLWHERGQRGLPPV